MKWMLHMIMLGVCSVEDIKEKSISLWKIAVYAGVIVGYGIWEFCTSDREMSDWLMQVLLGGVPGLMLLLLGRLSRQAVGYGDGLLTWIIGISWGFWESMGILLLAFFSASFAAASMLLNGRGKRNTELAFVPCLFLGMAGAGLWM